MKVPRVLKNTAIYSIIMILQKGIAFFLLPVYTAFLSPADYGILSVITSVTSFLSIFISFGLDAAAQRFYYRSKGDHEYVRKIFGTVACAVLCSSLILGAFFIAAHRWLIDPVLGGIDFYPYVFVGILNVIVTPMYLSYQGYLQTIQNGVEYGINTLCNFLLNVILIVLSLSVFRMGVMGILISNLIVSLLFFGYVAIAYLPKISFKIDISILKSELKYSLPLMPHSLFNWSNGTIDRLLVNGLRSSTDAGLYNLGQQYGSVMNLSANAINQAYVPWFFEKMNHGKEGIDQVVKVADVATSFIVVIALTLSLFAQEVFDVMITNSAYDNVWAIVPYIVFAYVFQGIYFFFVNVLFLKHTSVVFTVTMVSVIGNVAFNLWLIPIWGFMGSAIACFATYFIKSIFALIIASIKNKEIQFRWMGMYLVSFLALGLVMLTRFFVSDFSFAYALLLKSGILILFVGWLLLRYKNDLHLLYSIYDRKKHTKAI